MRLYGIQYILSLSDADLQSLASNRLYGMLKNVRSYCFEYTASYEVYDPKVMKACANRIRKVLNQRKHLIRTKALKRRKQFYKQSLQNALKNANLSWRRRMSILKSIRDSRKQVSRL